MKERIITGIVLVIAVFTAIFLFKSSYFALSLFGVGVIGLREWSNLIGLPKKEGYSYLFGGALGLATFLYLTYLGRFTALQSGLYGVMSLLWLMMPFLLFLYTRLKAQWLTSRIFLIPFSLLSLIAFAGALLTLQSKELTGGLGALIYLILLIAIADSGAYFVGRKFGRRKLAPSISPGKTVEGALGGIFFALLFALIGGGLLFDFGAQGDWLMLILLSIILVPISIAGDLFESVIKRHRGIKDSGTILPGHGGVLDRIDALTAAAPLFMIGLYFLI